MNHFLQRLMERHMVPGKNVLPIIRGRYEPDQISTQVSEKSLENGTNLFSNSILEEQASDELKQHTQIPGKVITNREVTKTQNEETDGNQFTALSPNTRETGFMIRKEEKLQSPAISGDVNSNNLPSSPAKPLQNSLQNIRNQTDKNNVIRKTAIAEPFMHEKPGVPDESAEKGSSDHSRTRKKNISDMAGRPFNLTSETQTLPEKKADEKFEGRDQNGGQGITQWPDDFKMAASDVKDTSQVGPTIKVNIGRIEVRAVIQQSAQSRPINDAPKSRQSLNEYLNRRNKDQQ